MLWEMFHACSKISTTSYMWEYLMPSCLEKYPWISTVRKVVTTTSVKIQPSLDKPLQHLLLHIVNLEKQNIYACCYSQNA